MPNSECQKDCLISREREISTAERLARVEAEIIALRGDIRDALISQLKDHGKRIASLERARAYSTGWIVGAGAVAGALASLVGRMF